METYILPLLGPLTDQGPFLIVILMGIVSAGSFVTSGFGVGGGVLMTSLFVFLLPPKFAIGLLAPLMLLISATGVRQYWKLWNTHHLIILLPSSLVGIWLGTHILAEISAEIVRQIVGLLAIIFGTIQFLVIDRPDWRNRLQPTTWQGVGLGLASGITGALAHTGGIVFSFYLLPHSRSKEIFVGTTVFLFFVQGLVKIGTYAYYNILTFPILIFSLTLIPALLFGSLAGRSLNRRLSNRLFMQLISIFVAVMGIQLILG